MNKKIIIAIIAFIAIAALSLFYTYYIADYTYEDERISITVPAGTAFNIKAEDAGGDLSKITYNDTSDKNIVIKIISLPDMNLLGVSMKNIALKAQEDSLKNESYTPIQITENYTIYQNNETGRYNALIKNPGFNGYVLIGCNGELEDIVKLAKSFKFKSYTTEGLTVEHIDNNTTNTTTPANITKQSNQVSTNSNKLSVSEDKNIGPGEEAPYHPDWSKQDYIDAGYRFTDPKGVG